MRSLILLLSTLAITGTTALRASHNFGGEFRYTYLSALTYEIEVRLYYNVLDPPDQPFIVIYTGDGGADTVAQEGSETLFSDCGDVMRYYSTQHTYSGPGVYSLSLRSPNRRAGIVNIPNSVDTPLCFDAEIVVGGFADWSPVLNNHLSNSYYAGTTFTHELQATDPDGDSLTYELLPPLGYECGPIPGYQFPDDVLPWQDTSMVDGHGIFTWTSPQIAGLYTIAIRCFEWRNGELLGHVTRDMTFCAVPPLTGVDDGPIHGTAHILQSPFNGPIVVVSEGFRPSYVDILDMRGALVECVRLSGTHTTIATDEMAAGIYLVKMTDIKGMITIGRFVVAR